MTKAIAALAAALCGCSPAADDAPRPWVPIEPLGEGMSEVVVWVQDHPFLKRGTVSDGCVVWHPEGVRCRIADDEASADVRVFADDGACVKNDDGSYTLATAYPDRVIVVRMRCFRTAFGGGVDERKLATVMGHEIGHELGVWEHVPKTCDGPHLTHPSDGPVCGRALMNPMYDKEVSFMTVHDHLAFEMRAGGVSLAGGTVAASGGAPTCEYVGP